MVEVKLPKIDLKELDALKAQNKKERLVFLEFYANYIKNAVGIRSKLSKLRQ